MGYYWSSMENDYFRHVRKCHVFQIYVDKIHQLLVLLHSMTSLCPFFIWGVNAIGLINPKASNNHHF